MKDNNILNDTQQTRISFNITQQAWKQIIKLTSTPYDSEKKKQEKECIKDEEEISVPIKKTEFSDLEHNSEKIQLTANQTQSPLPWIAPSIITSPSPTKSHQSLLKQAALRIEVKGGGCSGFMYQFDITREYNLADDYIITLDESKSTPLVVIDKISFSFLDNSELNHISNLEGEYFEIKNPNATSKCGCGSSFAI